MNTKHPLKRKLMQLAGLFPLASYIPSLPASNGDVWRIAFGSCQHQDKPQPVWDAVLADQPDLFIFLGDNIYGDTDDPAVLLEKYARQAQVPGFRKLRETTTVLATWDDHDYGRNDAGREYPMKEASRKIMLDFWNEPAGSERWRQPEGIYTSWTNGPAGRNIQVILLDLRFNRTALDTVSAAEYKQREAQNMGPYIQNATDEAVLMGEEQWQWLEAQLKVKADYRIIGSSIQCLADFTGWESWANFPKERERLFDLLARNAQTPQLIISGDVHWCELSSLQHSSMQQPLLELTSSGLTEIWPAISPNVNRVGDAFAAQNYGLVELDFTQGTAHLMLKEASGAVLLEHVQKII